MSPRPIAAMAIAAGLLGCDPVSLDDEGSCPAWTRMEEGRCVLRAWERTEAALSEAGASDVQVALGPEGEAALAWTHATVDEGHIVLAEAHGDGEWTATPVSAGEGTGVEPALALGPRGRALLAWKQQAADGAVYLATRDDARTWHWPQSPISWSGAAYEPRVAIGDDGEALVLWNQWTGENFGVALARRAPAQPDGDFVGPSLPAELLSPLTNYTNAPRMALGEDGELLITWYQAPVDDLSTYVRERPGALETWLPSQIVSPFGGPVDSHPEANPQPALHPSGEGAVVWTQEIAPGWVPVFLARRAASGTWVRPADIESPISALEVFARCPFVAFAPDGTLVATWYQTRDDHSEVIAWQRAPSEGRPEEPSIEVTVLSDPEVEAVHPALAFAPDGGAVVVWAQERDDAWQVVARRHQPQTERWLPAEPLSEAVPGLAPTPRIAVADDGRVLVAWAQGSVVEGRIYTAALR